MDVFDKGQQLEQEQRERAIARVRQQVPKGPEVDECDCGAQIAPERKKALPGVRTCIACAEREEKQKGSRWVR